MYICLSENMLDFSCPFIFSNSDSEEHNFGSVRKFIFSRRHVDVALLSTLQTFFFVYQSAFWVKKEEEKICYKYREILS